MWLTYEYCLIPQCWLHDRTIKNKNNYTLEDITHMLYMPNPYAYLN